MSVNVSEATDELKKLYHVLAEDLEEARTYGQRKPTAFARRSLFRAAFALIEGVSSKFRTVSLACAEATPGLLSTSEVAILKEEKFKLDDKGQPEASREYQGLLRNVLFSMRSYAKVHGTVFEPQIGQYGYSALKQFVAIRNALEHPKTLTDLELTDEKLRYAMEGMTWWKTEILRLLETCREADEYWKGNLA